MKKRCFAALALAALAAAGCGETERPAARAERPVVQEAPAPQAAQPVAANPAAKVDFSLPDMSGTVRHASEWAGKPMLVNFWATWCAPCRREIPLLKAAQDEYSELDLQVIGIAVDFQEDVVAYAEAAEFNYPVLVGQEDAMAVAETSGVDFIGLPFTMVVAPTGELLKTHIGEIVEAHIVEITRVLAALDRGELDLAGARAELGPL